MEENDGEKQSGRKGVEMLDSNQILDIMNQTFMLALRIALPFLLISMILGIVVAIFQAATNLKLRAEADCDSHSAFRLGQYPLEDHARLFCYDFRSGGGRIICLSYFLLSSCA